MGRVKQSNGAIAFHRLGIGDRFHTGKMKLSSFDAHFQDSEYRYNVFEKISKSVGRIVESVGYGNTRQIGREESFTAQQPVYMANVKQNPRRIPKAKWTISELKKLSIPELKRLGETLEYTDYARYETALTQKLRSEAKKAQRKNPLHPPKGTKFYLVDDRLKVIAYGNDYDKLQERSDRENENGKNLHVIEAKDYRIAMAQQGNPTTSNGAFTWSKNAHGWALLYNGEILARLGKNNQHSDYYTVEVGRSGDRETFKANTLGKAKTKALSLARKGFKEVKSYQQSQPSVSYVNKHLSKSVITKHGKAIRVSAAGGFDTSLYRIDFEDGYSQDAKIPKRNTTTKRNATPNGADAIYRNLLADAKLFHILYGQGTKAEKARANRLWNKALKLAGIKRNTSKRSNSGKDARYRIFAHLATASGHVYTKADNVWAASKKEAEQKFKEAYELEGLKLKSIRSIKKLNPNTRSNSGEVYNATKIDELSAMFNGRISGEEIRTVGSDFTPNLVSRLGQLSLMRIRNGKDVYEIKFDGDSWLGMDARKNLHIHGKDTRVNGVQVPRKGELFLVGNLEQINYITAKDHIENGKVTEYYHKLGEVDGIKPNVFIDHDKFLVINGGNYDIGVNGIEN